MHIETNRRENTPLPARLRPIIASGDGLIEHQIRSLWMEIEEVCEVTLDYHPNAQTMLHIGRGDVPLFGAFDPERTHAATMFGLVASRGETPVAVLTVAIYALGSFDLAEYLERYGLFDECPQIHLQHPARGIAIGIRGSVAFSGNLWIAREQRKSAMSALIARRFGELGRAIGYGTLDCQHSFFFMRDKIIQKGVNTEVQHRAPGVSWGGEDRWIGYSGERFMIAAATRSLDRASPTRAGPR